ncbi:tyrosine-type recombinase/integrase [Nesterenkonia sp. K-15-9-6]|uniref:tyrosine-type recombinase/integrase n=1 Tax=Nesterenkonia sp. K-15-9-6 TaxID=3093918 RepID=UPI0040448AEE
MFGHLAHDPTAQIPSIKVPRAVPRPAPSDAIERGLQKATTRRDVLMILLGNYGGLRCHEIAALHSNDFHDGVLWITGKGGHRRIVPAHRLLVELLDLFPAGYYFPSELNPTGHYRPASISRRIRTLMPDGWSAHTLRHRFATEFFSRTPDLMALKDLLGHASVATTQIYTATSPSRLQAGVLSMPDLDAARSAAQKLRAIE